MSDPTVPGQARDERALQAARDSVEPTRLLPGEGDTIEDAQRVLEEDRLLPGEDPSGTLIDDIEHWVAVYSELLDFKQFMLAGAAARAAAMTEEVSRLEIEATDLTVARAEAERFTRRLAFWRGRLEAATDQFAPATSPPR